MPPKVIEEANEKVVIRLRNQGPTAKYHYQVSLKVGNEVKNREIKILSPKAQETLEFPLAVQTKWRRQWQEVKVTAENKTYESIIVVGSWLDRGLAPIKAFLKI